MRDVMVPAGRAATLAEFVAARLDETTALAVLVRSDIEEESVEEETGEGVRTLADFVVADCEAKRRIVEMISDAAELRDTYALNADYRGDVAYIHQEGAVSDRVLLALVQPYADHPDFRPEWRL